LKAFCDEGTLNSIFTGVTKRWMFRVALLPLEAPRGRMRVEAGRKAALVCGCVASAVSAIVGAFLRSRN
jgi:hypothetical protein